VIPDRWKLLVGMLAGTGCRWGEATVLRWNDLGLDARRASSTDLEGTEAWSGRQ
jgi:integrase